MRTHIVHSQLTMSSRLAGFLNLEVGDPTAPGAPACLRMGPTRAYAERNTPAHPNLIKLYSVTLRYKANLVSNPKLP